MFPDFTRSSVPVMYWIIKVASSSSALSIVRRTSLSPLLSFRFPSGTTAVAIDVQSYAQSQFSRFLAYRTSCEQVPDGIASQSIYPAQVSLPTYLTRRMPPNEFSSLSWISSQKDGYTPLERAIVPSVPSCVIALCTVTSPSSKLFDLSRSFWLYSLIYQYSTSLGVAPLIE